MSYISGMEAHQLTVEWVIFSSLLVPPSVPGIRLLPHLSASNRRLSSMGCSRLGQSRSLLSGGVHQRRGTNPADLVGSTGRSGSNPPGKGGGGGGGTGSAA